jgi:hypothetical protein
MFEQSSNLFVVYDLVKDGKQSLGIMAKIDVQIMIMKEIKQLLLEGEISNVASFVALFRATDIQEHSTITKPK